MVVRLENDMIVEIFPEEFKTIAEIEFWYNKYFADHSVVTDQTVEQGMILDHDTGFFRWPDPPPASSEELLNILMGVPHGQ